MVKTGVSQLKGWKDSRWCLKAAASALLTSLVFAACASAPKTHYFTLQVPPPPSSPEPRTHFVLQVERFEAPYVLSDNRIIYYTSPTELNFHEYNRWSSDPAELLSETAMKYFAETGLFQHVYPYPAPVQADFTLRGRVLNFDEMRYKKKAGAKSTEARLGLKLDLLQTQQNKVVWSARLEQTSPIKEEKVPEVVDALNVAADQLLRNAYSGISQVVEHEFAQKQEQAQ